MLASCGIQAVVSPSGKDEGPSQRGQACRQVTEQPGSTSELGIEEPERQTLCAPPNYVQMLGQARENAVSPQFQCDLPWGYRQIPAEMNSNYKPLAIELSWGASQAAAMRATCIRSAQSQTRPLLRLPSLLGLVSQGSALINGQRPARRAPHPEASLREGLLRKVLPQPQRGAPGLGGLCRGQAAAEASSGALQREGTEPH